MTIKRDLGYDFVRFFAMMLIIIVHFVTVSLQRNFILPQYLLEIVRRGPIGFSHVGVYLFFILSGAVLKARYTNDIKINIKNFYISRFKRIVVPNFWLF